MIYSVSGTLVVCESGLAVVEAAGVGYQLSVSDRCFGALTPSLGQKVLLFTHLCVREDGVELFGFLQRDELELFRLLNTVSGVGPKAALAILSALSPDEVISAVLCQDAKALCTAQGIGNKIAQRLILELRDKLAKERSVSGAGSGAIAAPVSSGNAAGEAVNALVVLGYSRQQAMSALSGVDTKNAGVEELIRIGLKNISKQ